MKMQKIMSIKFHTECEDDDMYIISRLTYDPFFYNNMQILEHTCNYYFHTLYQIVKYHV